MNKTKSIIDLIRVRIVYGKLFIKGKLSFSLFLFSVLPAFMYLKMDTTKPFNLFGKPFIVPKGEKQDITLLNFIHQIIGHNQYRIELIKKDGVVIDAGANMGVFSIMVAANYPNVIIYAFEPVPATFEILRENTKYYPNIKIFNCGLGEKEKTASLVMTGHSSSCYITENPTDKEYITMDIKTVDDFNLPVSFIKMDTEGYEANIIEGASETIKKYKPTFVMSAYHKPNDEKTLPALLHNIIPYDCELRFDCEKDLTCKPRE